ncbi:MAG TPA: TIGR03546 family protein [Deltaproteobacteria bacterium]|nr:TIGR03546 family protein [Deltaproteobacteria bacterium]
MIRLIARVLRVLNSEAAPSQISLALCFSLIAGFTPLMSMHNVVVLLLVLLIRVNLASFLLGLVAFSGIAYLLDPLFHLAGLALLTATPLEGLWTTLYNTALFRIARLNNTLVLGSLVISLVLFLPAYFLFNTAVVRYRGTVLAWVRTTRIAQIIKLSKLYKTYESLSFLGERP